MYLKKTTIDIGFLGKIYGKEIVFLKSLDDKIPKGEGIPYINTILGKKPVIFKEVYFDIIDGFMFREVDKDIIEKALNECDLSNNK